MKHLGINIVLVAFAVACMVWCIIAPGAQFWIGFIPFLAAVYTLIKVNEDEELLTD